MRTVRPPLPEGATRYILTCPARTGSTMLNTCLRQHDDICSHGEVFGPSGPLAFYGLAYRLDPPIEDLLVELRENDPVWFLERAVFRGGRKGAVGCKFKYEEMLLPQYESVMEALGTDLGVHVIHLTRHDLLQRYLSEHVAVHVTKVFNVQKGPTPDEVVVRLDPEACLADFERTEERTQRIRHHFRDHPVLELSYEDLHDDVFGTLALVQEFLGVPTSDLEPTTKKLRRSAPADVIENFDELAAFFRGGPYERFFR